MRCYSWVVHFSFPFLVHYRIPGDNQIHEYLSAVLYFLFTTWIFKKTGSLWVCILIHGLTNLGIAFLVRYGGMEWLWG